MSDEHAHEHEHEHHSVNYTAIFGLLCVCTVLSIFFDVMKSQMSYPLLLTLILGVALCKATFVLLYFMHIKFERAWKYVLLAPTAVLACALPFALAPDIAFHYYFVAAPQREVLAAEHGTEHGAAAHGDVHGSDAHDATAHSKTDDHVHTAKDHAANKAASKPEIDPHKQPVKKPAVDKDHK